MTLYDDAAAIREAANRKFAEIRGDDRLSHAGRQRLMAPHLLRMKQQLADLQWRSDTYREQRATELKRRTFGTPGTDAITRMDHRDAIGRASQITDPAVAEFQMRRSLEHGDTIMAKALAQSAVDNGWSQALKLYIAANPHTGDALAEIEALKPTAQTKITDAMWFHPDTPQELANLDDNQLSALAAESQAIAAAV